MTGAAVHERCYADGTALGGRPCGTRSVLMSLQTKPVLGRDVMILAATHYLTGLPSSATGSAQTELDNFATQLSREFKIPKPKADNWDELPWHLADRVSGGNAILIVARACC
jgi:hypothetical protein